jgi:hypothetical protein
MTSRLITTEQQEIICKLLRFAKAISNEFFEDGCSDIDSGWLQETMFNIGLTEVVPADSENPNHAAIMIDWEMKDGDDIHISQVNKMTELLAPLLVSCNKP